MAFFIFLSFRFYKIAKQPTVLSMQHAPVKSADGKMVLAERIHLTPTYAEDILTEIAGGNLPFRLPPAAVQCWNHHSRLSTALYDPHGDGAKKRRSVPSL